MLAAIERISHGALRLAGARSLHVDTSVARVHGYELRGRGRGTFVLIHGMGTTSTSYLQVALMLARRAELRGVMEKTAYGAEHVVRAIERALVARRPRARYAAPRRAGWAIAWFRLLPVGLRDFVLGRFAGLDALHRRR